MKTSAMLEEIIRMAEEYEKSSCNNKLVREALSVDYVYRSNVGESVGTQSFEGTQSLLEPFLEGRSESSPTSPTRERTREERESINTFNALKAVYQLREQMENTGAHIY